MSTRKPWRYFIELGSSNSDSPLFLAVKDERHEWQSDVTAAKTFAYHHEAWDYVLANSLPASRITCR